jgi:4-oxalocrotonate tautomerase
MPIIQFNMMEGRTVEQKRQLARKVTETVSAVLDVSPETVRILFHEVTTNDFSVAGVTAAERQESQLAGTVTGNTIGEEL